MKYNRVNNRSGPDFNSRTHGVESSYILEVFAKAKSNRERRSALDLALIAFNHHDTQEHNRICSAGGITLVTRCLQLQLNQSDCLSKSELHVIDSICQLLALLFRCSSDNGSVAFQLVGADLVSVIVSTVYEQDRNAPSSPIKALVDLLTDLDDISIIATQKNKLLMRLLQQLVRDEYESPYLMLVGCKLLRGLSKRPDNKKFIAHHPALVDDLISLLLYPAVSEDVTCEVSECIKHLAWEWSIKSELVAKKNFLEGMHKILRRKWQNRELGKMTILSAIETIRRLSTEASCRARICSYKKGSFIKVLIITMKTPALYTDAVFAILRLIDQVTAPRILEKCPEVVNILSTALSVICKQLCTDHSIRDYRGKLPLKSCLLAHESISKEVCLKTSKQQHSNRIMMAANTLNRLARIVTVNDKAHPLLMNALANLALSNDSKSRLCAAKGFREQSRTSAGRFYMVRTPKVLDILVVLANDSCRMVQSSATEALLWFSSDSLNVKRLAQRADVLETFVRNGKKAAMCLLTCRSSIQAIISIASQNSSLSRIAKTLELVEVLSNYGVSDDTDVSLKSASLQCVVLLAPLM
jgi:hypothetical protein